MQALHHRRLWHPRHFQEEHQALVLYPLHRSEGGIRLAEPVGIKITKVQSTLDSCRYLEIIESTLYNSITVGFRYLHRVTQCFTFLVMRKQPLNPDVPMKPLYWTRIIVPVTATSQSSDTAESPTQVNKREIINDKIHC